LRCGEAGQQRQGSSHIGAGGVGRASTQPYPRRDHSREWLDRPEWPEPRRNPDFVFRLITDKPVEPGENEQRSNPRSRSAKLRVAEKI